jgi:hypothetical protein
VAWSTFNGARDDSIGGMKEPTGSEIGMSGGAISFNSTINHRQCVTAGRRKIQARLTTTTARTVTAKALLSSV